VEGQPADVSSMYLPADGPAPENTPDQPRQSLHPASNDEQYATSPLLEADSTQLVYIGCQ